MSDYDCDWWLEPIAYEQEDTFTEEEFESYFCFEETEEIYDN